MSILLKRTLTVLITLPLVIAAVWFEQPLPWFTILILVWSAVGTWEFFNLNRKTGLKPMMYFGIVISVLLVAVREPKFISVLNTNSGSLSLAILTMATVIPLMWLLRREPHKEAFNSWAWTLAGICYVGFLMGHLVALRDLEYGRNWVFFALLVTFASDTAAFFVGRSVGRHKLAPAISPSKTWEGSIGGIFGAGLISLIFLPSAFSTWSNPLYLPGLNVFSAIALAFLVSIFGQLGDLVESLFKRNMGVKDSGSILPGHGGALDRIDSVAFAGVMVYYFVWLIL
jgi:phosphatidate cytidylyltransferase